MQRWIGAGAALFLGVWLSNAALARENRYQTLDLGAARTQKKLTFYRELPTSRRAAENLSTFELPCGTPLTPVAYQLSGDRADALAFISFSAPHVSGHILLDEADRQQANLLDYLLFDSGGIPFCQARLEQTLSQCGNVGVSLFFTAGGVLQAEIQNLATDQVLFIDWVGSRLIADGKATPVLPSDVFVRALEQELPAKASSLFYDLHPLTEISPLGLGSRAGLRGYAADTGEGDLQALWELSKRVGIDVSTIVFEPLGPGQRRSTALSLLIGGGWKTAGVLPASTRGTRFTLSLPIARSNLGQTQAQTGKAPANMVVPQGPLSAGAVQVTEAKAPSTEACTIGFTIR